MRIWGLMGIAFSVMMVSGCKEKTGERRYDTKTGTVKAIDVETGEVTLEITTKKGEKKVISGWVRQETEIIINGKVAKLEDVKPMEEVKVTGYIEGEGLSRRYVATRVEVDRAQELTLGGGEEATPEKKEQTPATKEATPEKKEDAAPEKAPAPK